MVSLSQCKDLPMQKTSSSSSTEEQKTKMGSEQKGHVCVGEQMEKAVKSNICGRVEFARLDLNKYAVPIEAMTFFSLRGQEDY